MPCPGLVPCAQSCASDAELVVTQMPEALALHRSMHANLRSLRLGASKSPSAVLDEALQQSAQVVLLLAECQNVELEDRIQLLFEAGEYRQAKRELDRFMTEANWCQRWLYNRQHGAMVKAIRRAVQID